MLYLDHAATTPLRPGVWEAMAPFATDRFGNPSGSHEVSRKAKNALEVARERAAALIGAQPLEVVFTGGGTESDNLALKGAALAREGRRGVVTVATEHPAVLESGRFLARLGCPLTLVGVDRYGRVDPDEVAGAVADTTAVVSVMTANNETGTIQPVRKVVDAVRTRFPDVLIHTDAVQAFVSEEVSVDDLGVDLLTLAAHKLGGPKGVGLLYVRRGTRLEPLLHGGGQELGRRSGTHNVAGAVGMAEAMELTGADRARFRAEVVEARQRFERRLVGRSIRTVPEEVSLVQHAHLRFPGRRNETLLVRLDRLGLAASTASACHSGAATVSHVLTAMGIPPSLARESLRFSFGWTTRPADGDRAAELIQAALES
jgi:cysteine desulfurase